MVAASNDDVPNAVSAMGTPYDVERGVASEKESPILGQLDSSEWLVSLALPWGLLCAAWYQSSPDS